MFKNQVKVNLLMFDFTKFEIYPIQNTTPIYQQMYILYQAA